MVILKINSQNRRDFRADFICEGCGDKQFDVSGYDDSYFHSEVIPKKKCNKCGESGETLKSDYRPLSTKYPDGMHV